MKKTILFVAAALAALTAGAQQKAPVPRLNPGVGPVMNVNTNQTYGSDLRVLPENAQTFINTLFPDVAVAVVERDVKDKEYEVKMADGYEVLFDYAGNWLEVESPDNATLSSEIIQKLVPENVVIETLSGDAVAQGGVVNYVEEIDYIPGFGYVVEYAVTPANKGKVAIDSNGNVTTMKALKAKTSKDAGKYARKNSKSDKSKSYKKNKEGKKGGKSGRSNSYRGERGKSVR